MQETADGADEDDADEDEAVPVDAELLRQAAARFCQAVADLEALGLVKRSARAGGSLQRVVFPPECL